MPFLNDIWRIKWLGFFITVVFLQHNKTVGKLRCNGLLLTSARSNRQHNRSWMKGLAKIHKKSELVHCLQCLLSGATERDPMDSEKRLHVYKSGATMACQAWRVDKSSGNTRRNRQACLKVVWLSMGKICVCIYGLRSELVNFNCLSIMIF